MDDCIFCRIVAGEAAASVVFETPDTLAFLDLRSFHDGHTLVIPKVHVPDVFALDDAAGAALISATVRVARAIREEFRPEGLSLWQSNGPAANQEVPHVHVHIMPRYADDGLLQIYPSRPKHPSREELDVVARSIADRVRL